MLKLNHENDFLGKLVELKICAELTPGRMSANIVPKIFFELKGTYFRLHKTL
jgi:hypothetical protein